MTASWDDTRSTSRGDQRQCPSARENQYMIAPATPGLAGQETLNDRLSRIGGIEIVRTHAERATVSPPIAVVRASDENAAALRRSTGGELVIEADCLLRAALLGGLSPQFQATALTTALGTGLTVTIRAVTENNRPVAHAEVRLVGEQCAAQGLTDEDGKANLTLYGELPETVAELFVKPRSGYWGLWRHRPELRVDAVNTFTLESLSPPDEFDWGGKAMRFDRLPAECRGAGIKVALIDSGV